MAIAPVSSVNFKNNYGQVNFGKKENHTNSHISSSAKVIPLATMIALSPLNKINATNDAFVIDEPSTEQVEQGGQVIKSKTFNKIVVNYLDQKRYPSTMKFNFIDTDGNKNTFEKVEIEQNVQQDGETFNSTAKLTTFGIYHLQMTSEDGSVNGTSTVYTGFMDKENGTTKTIRDKDVCEFLKTELTSPRNNSDVKINERTNSFHTTTENVLKLGAAPSMKDANPINVTKYKHTGTDDFDGDNGKYTLNYYSIFGEKEVELITVKRPNCPELAVQKVYKANGYIGDFFNNQPQFFMYDIVELIDADRNKHYIMDKHLSDMLSLIHEQPEVSSVAYYVKNLDTRYIATPNGVLVPSTH